MAAKKTDTAPVARPRITVECKGGRTHQSFKDECDVNQVMKRYEKTGILRQSQNRPQYGDFSNVGDYQEALNTVIQADKMFGELSATVRRRFDNDPQQFLDFVEDPNNQDEAIQLGSQHHRSRSRNFRQIRSRGKIPS